MYIYDFSSAAAPETIYPATFFTPWTAAWLYEPWAFFSDSDMYNGKATISVITEICEQAISKKF
jgi:hypothetical protein